MGKSNKQWIIVYEDGFTETFIGPTIDDIIDQRSSDDVVAIISCGYVY